MNKFFAALAGLLASQAALAHDPISTDGDKYRVLLDNDRVRVLAYEDRPGDRTQMHEHPAFVLYALSPFKRKLTLPDGKTLLREFRAGDVIYSGAQQHIGENVGDTPTRVLMIELRTPAAASEPRK